MAHAIITGGSSGIGLAIARILAKSGHDLTLIARGEDRLKAAQTELNVLCQHPEQKIAMRPVDVSDYEQVQVEINAAIDKLGSPSDVYLSAGIVDPGYFKDLEIDKFRNNMDVNYFGCVHVSKAVLPSMIQKHGGKIILISSAAGLIGLWGYGAYSPSKFALHGLGEVLRAELKPHNIQISVVFPPDTDTPQFQAEKKIRPKETDVIAGSAKVWPADKLAEHVVRKVNSGRFLVTPGLEITALSLFKSLVSPLLNLWFDFLVKVKCH
ncbi:SDR family oxidoreductase [Rhodospirillales bacterium]|nr:SDR family oxidoreductase [Rhodospirillales bacterium]